MKRKKPLLFILLGVCGAVVLVLLGISLPSASGRPVRSLVLKAGNGDTNALTQLARLGSKGTEDLEQLLQARDSAFWLAKERLGARLSRVRFLSSLGRWILSKNGPEAVVYRIAAAEALGRLGKSSVPAVPALLRALHDPRADVRWRAATALARIGPSAVDGLTRKLEDPDPVVRQAAAYALGEMREDAESSVPSLLLLTKDQNPDVRSSAAYSLAMIGFPSMLSLSNIIATGDSPAREAAVKVLAQYRRAMRQTVPALIQMAHSDSVASRELALETLGGLRFADDGSMAALKAGLKDESPEVRLAALRALNQVIWRGEGALPELQACLADESTSVREWALKTLGRLGSKASPALPQVQQIVEGPDSHLHALAAETARQIRGEGH